MATRSVVQRVALAALAGGLVSLAGCAAEPVPGNALLRAATAVDLARAHGAVSCAPALLNQARFKLERARVLADRYDDFSQARLLAEEAEADALAAYRQARAAGAAARPGA